MENKKILFLSSSHFPYDDRIFYHMATTLLENKYDVQISTSTIDCNETKNGIKIDCFDSKNISKKEKITNFIEIIENYKPELIICSEPLPVYAAYQFKKKFHTKIPIIYDITEWYPSKKNLRNHNVVIKAIIFIKLLIFNMYVSKKVNTFIFGEFYKSIIYKFLFPKTKNIFITYYPDLRYIDYRKKNINPNKITLCYTGQISIEKGIRNFIEVCKKTAEFIEKVNIKIIGKCQSPQDEQSFKALTKSLPVNCNLENSGIVNYESFSTILQDVDFFFDLRKQDLENNHCLPIKIFFYAACGKPVIYSNLKSIRNHIDHHKFALLTKPDAIENIVNFILTCTNQPNIYQTFANNARKIVEEKYNWNLLIEPFLKMIEENLRNKCV